MTDFSPIEQRERDQLEQELSTVESLTVILEIQALRLRPYGCLPQQPPFKASTPFPESRHDGP